MFITFEGVDGAGKSTQVAKLAAYLTQRGKEVVTTREPGGTALGEKLRGCLLDEKVPLIHRAEVLLYLADRAQHVAQVIQPALNRNWVVICDRYGDSTLAYQGYGQEATTEEMLLLGEINRYASCGVVPYLTILLDVDPLVGIGRRGGAGIDRTEKRGLEYLQKVRQGFLALAEQEPARIKIIEAGAEPETVHRAVRGLVGDWR